LAIVLFKWADENRPANKKWLLASVGAISFLFVWTYGGFVFVPFFILAFCIALSVYRRKIVFAPLAVSMAGMGLGVMLHPHGGNFVTLMYDQLFRTGLGAGSEVPAGGEWRPFDLLWFIKSNLLLLLAWAMAIILELERLYRKQKISWESLWMHGTALGLLALTLWHRRFIEYWVPFVVLAAAVSLSPQLAKISWKGFRESWSSHAEVRVILSLLAASTIITLGYNVYLANYNLGYGEYATTYKGASEWMADNSERGDIIFDTQWDQFPQLFYWNDKNYYLVGMDPTFMHIYDRDLYWKWRKIADDNPEDWTDAREIRRILKDDFKAKFVFADTGRNPDIVNYLNMYREYFTETYRSGNIVVIEVK
jgi:hypothetical protein